MNKNLLKTVFTALLLTFCTSVWSTGYGVIWDSESGTTTIEGHKGAITLPAASIEFAKAGDTLKISVTNIGVELKSRVARNVEMSYIWLFDEGGTQLKEYKVNANDNELPIVLDDELASYIQGKSNLLVSYQNVTITQIELVEMYVPETPIVPAYGTIWENGEATIEGGNGTITLSTAYFKDFAKVGDSIKVSVANVGQQLKSRVARNVRTGKIWLCKEDGTKIGEDYQVEANAEEVIIGFDESIFAYVNSAEKIHIGYQNVEITKIELIEGESEPVIEPFYGTIWNSETGETTIEGKKGQIVLSTAYFNNFAKAGDSIKVSVANVGKDLQVPSARRVIKNGVIELFVEGNTEAVKTWDNVSAEGLVFALDEELLGKIGNAENIIFGYQTLEITAIELVEKIAPVEESDLMKEAKALAADTEAVAVGKLIAAIAAAEESGDETELKAAVDQFKADNADVEKDETAKVATNGWKKFETNDAAGVCDTQYAPAITTYDGRTAQLAEVYESTVERTGQIIYQNITGLQNGSYKVGFYGNAFFTEGRGFESTMAEGAEDVAYVFANEQQAFITAHIATSTTENDFRQFDVEVTDGTIKLGMGKAKAGTNWHTMQIYQLTWFTTAKEAYAAVQTELQSVLTEAKALAADESKTEGKDVFQLVINAAEQAVGSNMLNINEVENLVANLKDGIKEFKKANIIIPEGKYYLLAAAYEGPMLMAAGNSWGTQGIVNEMGLDLNFIYNDATEDYTIETNVYNGNKHFLGSNLYMDSDAFGWTIEGEFVYTIGAVIDGVKKYIAVGSDNTLTLTEDGTADNAQWAFMYADFWENKAKEEGLKAMEAATAENGVDATFLLKDADFNRNDHRWDAWTVSEDCTNKNLGGGCDGSNGNGCAESYHSTFTISQLVEGAPAGIYTLTAQGFYRQDNGAEEAAPVFFANGVTAEVPVKTGEENNMTSAGISFTNGLYTIEPITFVVGEDSTLTVGVQSTSTSQWVIWDNFQLTYYGKATTPEPDIEDGVYDLTTDMFKHWESHEATEGETIGCAYVLNEATGLPYGDSNVFWLNYANLSGYDKLVVLVSEGAPRFCFNRTEDNAQDNGDPETTKFIDIPGKAWGTDAYETVDENNKRFTIDLKKMTEERGFAHLHCIKGANWANVTVKEMKLVKGNVDLPSAINEVKADMQNGVIYNLNGQKVEKAVKGLYITNGKKILVK